MKKNYIILLMVLFAFAGNAQVINLDDDFKFSVLSAHPEIDANSDGNIEVSEAAPVTQLNLMYLADMNGIVNFPNLKHFECRGTVGNSLDFTPLSQLEYISFNDFSASISTLNLSGLANLKHVDVGGAYLSALDLASSMNTLEYLDISSNTQLGVVNYTAYPNLKHLDCADMYTVTITVAGMTQLEYLNASNNFMPSIDLSGLPNLEYLNWSGGQLTSLDVAPLTSLKYLNCFNNQITSLAVDNLTNLEYLNCSRNQLTALNVVNLTNLTTLECEVNAIPTLAIAGLTNLTRLVTAGNPLGNLPVTALTGLTYLVCRGNQLTTLDLAPLTNLTYLDCSVNQLTTLNLTTMGNLQELQCYNNQLAVLDLSNCVLLERLSCGGNPVTGLDLTASPLLTYLSCGGSQLASIDLSNAHHLRYFEGAGCLFGTLDFSALNDASLGVIDYVFRDNPNLTYVNVKNSATGFNAPTFPGGPLNQLNCPNLVYVCANENDIATISGQLQSLGATGVQVNSYCSFVPGGAYNNITGTVTLDLDSNGCGTGDAHIPGVKLTLSNGMNNGATFTDNFGNFGFPVDTGFFTLTPVLESPYFTITPASATIQFDNIDQSTQTADFCLSPNGIHNDLEVSIASIIPARPGFDATYLITYKNKGNQTLSGSVTLAFDDSVLDFVSANPAVTTQGPNLLSWDYAALLPFESRTATFVMNVNSPLETPAVDIGQSLYFTATINPVAGDETPQDNVATLDQIVVGSYDPNDKTCVEGSTMTPSMVGEYLHYVIRFQNSGTFYAENVVVKDIIDANKFDISTLQLTASSHPQVTRITGNKVEFIFEGINLPAEQDDEPGSHGFVAFKIKTKPNLVLNDVVENTADIFFDFNAPIVTNTTSTTVSTLGVGHFEDTSVSIAPNPVRNILNISASAEITSIQLFDVAGRLLQAKLENDTFATLDFTGKTNGVYFVKVYTEKGMKVQKVIKE